MFRKRRRYVFRKRSIRGRILGSAIGVLVMVAGLVLFVPWLMFYSTDEDAPNTEETKNQTEQASPKDPEDQPEQATGTARSEGEEAHGDTPTFSEGASNDPLSPSPVQPSPPSFVQFPPLPATPPPSTSVQVPSDFSTPSENWDYYEPGYWDDFGTGYEEYFDSGY